MGQLRQTIARNSVQIIVAALILMAGIAALAWQLNGGNGDTHVDVSVPELSDLASAGRSNFDANCVQCHGVNAAGSDRGPPLVHDIYNPGHHGDGAFYAAAILGAVQHHWRYGNMPAQPQVDEDAIAAIVQYVRELQQANGIEFRKHRMQTR